MPLRISLSGSRVRVLAEGASGMAWVWLFGYDDRHVARIGGGENIGATLAEMNVVRSVTPLSTLNGRAAGFTAARTHGEHLAVVLQRDDGTVLCAAVD